MLPYKSSIEAFEHESSIPDQGSHQSLLDAEVGIYFSSWLAEIEII
jgi:hypothetical protein